MKNLLTLSKYLFLGLLCANGSVFAADLTDGVEVAGQPLVHPEADISYMQDMRDDELLAKSTPTDEGQIRYTSGGIAVSGMRAIEAEERLYNLKILFVEGREGEYVTDTSVKLTDENGKYVLEAMSRGPVMLVNVPPGFYTLSTEADDGSRLTRKVEASGDHLDSYVMRYPTKN